MVTRQEARSILYRRVVLSIPSVSMRHLTNAGVLWLTGLVSWQTPALGVVLVPLPLQHPLKSPLVPLSLELLQLEGMFGMLHCLVTQVRNSDPNRPTVL